MSQRQTATAEASNLSQLVVEAVADAEGVDPLELSSPLYEVIDPDALDQVFAVTSTDGRRDGQVTLSYNGYEVTVCGDGYVTVEEREG